MQYSKITNSTVFPSSLLFSRRMLMTKYFFTVFLLRQITNLTPQLDYLSNTPLLTPIFFRLTRPSFFLLYYTALYYSPVFGTTYIVYVLRRSELRASVSVDSHIINLSMLAPRVASLSKATKGLRKIFKAL